MKTCIYLIVLGLAISNYSCQNSEPDSNIKIKAQVLTVLKMQVAAWNQGDIAGYMAGYLRSDSLRFASGGTVTFGWQTTLERYQKSYPNRATMGKLDFSDAQMTVLSEDAVLVFGRWGLRRATDNPGGLFSLLFRKTDDGWFIVHDHTSSAKEN
ncbi:MAG: DUF4440 domain-containing protein [Calditrichaeota bacterium]|nr:MAG: DUF4440 domain-containing protein [Calditrichota bacterium]